MKVFGLPVNLLIGLVGAGLLLVLLALFIVIMVRREQTRSLTARAQAAAKAPRGAKGNGSAWEQTRTNRAARDKPVARFEDDLPPISMDTSGWGDVYESSPDTQSRLIASQPAPQPANGVYKTGFNPFYTSEVSEIHVEEVADLVQQAELMTTLENYPVAINMLTRHIRETEKPAPKAWLMLFDLYSRTGRRDQYENLAKGFRILFNAQVPSWDQQLDAHNKQLEDYPQVIGKVQRLWGLPSCRAFLESLLYDDRGGARQGFMLAAYSDIIFLLDTIDTALQIQAEKEERHRIELKLQGDNY